MRKLILLRDSRTANRPGRAIGSLWLDIPEKCQGIDLGYLGRYAIKKTFEWLPLAFAERVIEQPKPDGKRRSLDVTRMLIINGCFFYGGELVGPVAQLSVQSVPVPTAPMIFQSEGAQCAIIAEYRAADVSCTSEGLLKIQKKE